MFTDIRLQKYRSYEDESYEFGDGVNIVVGPNASGKTNLLEALYIASLGRSFRAKDSELIAFGSSWARIDANNDANNQRTTKIITQPNGATHKEFIINNQKLVRMTPKHAIPVVLFEPNHLTLLHGSPEYRREYLDDLLERIVTGYGKIRREYRRILSQRNTLLKASKADQLFAWNVRLSEVGAKIAEQRYVYTREINQQLGDMYRRIARSGSTRIQINYINSCGCDDISQYGTKLLRMLENRQNVDLERGHTTVGPHREDIIVSYNERGASEVASRGEIRTILLTLKIIELQLLEDANNQKPIFLLDDVFSELDGSRRKALTENINNHQTFITTTDADIVVQHFLDKHKIIACQRKLS